MLLCIYLFRYFVCFVRPGFLYLVISFVIYVCLRFFISLVISLVLSECMSFFSSGVRYFVSCLLHSFIRLVGFILYSS